MPITWLQKACNNKNAQSSNRQFISNKNFSNFNQQLNYEVLKRVAPHLTGMSSQYLVAPHFIVPMN